jgi:hypothetical protein
VRDIPIALLHERPIVDANVDRSDGRARDTKAFACGALVDD